MEAKDRQRLAKVMAQMAEDPAAAVTLYREFGDSVRATVMRVVRNLHATHLTPEDVEAMVVDVCLELAEVAGAWDPDGGALPWVWAERRVVKVVSGHVGQYADPWDDDLHGGAPGVVVEGPSGGNGPDGSDPDEDDLLQRLARHDARCALLREALELTASERDQRLFLFYELQRTSGDPSPANTAAASFGMRAAAVRQAVGRVRARLVALAARDGRFALLEALPIVSRCSAA